MLTGRRCLSLSLSCPCPLLVLSLSSSCPRLRFLTEPGAPASISFSFRHTQDGSIHPNSFLIISNTPPLLSLLHFSIIYFSAALNKLNSAVFFCFLFLQKKSPAQGCDSQSSSLCRCSVFKELCVSSGSVGSFSFPEFNQPVLGAERRPQNLPPSIYLPQRASSALTP